MTRIRCQDCGREGTWLEFKSIETGDDKSVISDNRRDYNPRTECPDCGHYEFDGLQQAGADEESA